MRSSTFASAAKRSGLLLLAGAFAWMIYALGTLDLAGKKRSTAPSPQRPLYDKSAEKARAHVEQVAQGLSRREAYGVVDGSFRKLSADQADALKRAHAIQGELRALRTAYVTAQNLKAANTPGVDEAYAAEHLAEAKNQAMEKLKAFPREDVKREIQNFGEFVASDPEAQALFAEVAQVVGDRQ